uniref:Uncharacterized protein n=1 Tax=Panagrolaimus davidi TaxID=227884 RepID=A0A914PKK0_9BILA
MSPYYNNLLSACLPINKKFAVTLSVDENQFLDLDIKFLEKIKPKSRKTKYSLPQKFTLGQINPEKVPYAFGIDLGTTRCCAAVNRRNGIETVALDNMGERLLPSYVAFDEEKEKCGQIVINRLRNHAKSSVFDSKRIIGKKFEDINIDQSWTFEVIQDKKSLMLQHSTNILEQLTNKLMLILKALENNDTFTKSETTIGTRLIPPEYIASVLLEHIKEKVEEFEGSRKARVMITIPSTFTDSQKDSTCVAAILAGFDVVDFMPEPVAAAFGYLIEQPRTDHNFTFLLFDLGGGTLDICIFKFERNQIEILSQNGNQNLGGRDFDNVLINFFSQKLFYDYGINDFGSKKYKLMLECQKIKEILSTCDEAFLEIDEIVFSIEETIKIARREFEELSTELLEKIKTCVIYSLKECELKAENIDKILLVGGGSRMPMIKELLRNLFPNSEHLCAKHPEEIVAVGAAYYSCYLASLLIEDKKLLELTEYQYESEEENEEEIASDEVMIGFLRSK